MNNIDFIIKQVNATMAMEDMPLTEVDKNRIRFCIENPQRIEAEIQFLIKKHFVESENWNEQRLLLWIRIW